MQCAQTFRFGTHRLPLNELPDVALPFYPRSAGHFLLQAPWVENVPAGEKDFVQLFWFVRGEAEFLLDGEMCRMQAGDVCYHLPGEPHFHRSISQYAEYRWIVFDGRDAAKFLLDFNYPRCGWHAGDCPENLFVEYCDRLREMTPYSYRRMCAIAAEILACAGRDGKIHSPGGQLFHRAAALCREKFSNHDFNVNALADAMKLDRTTLSRHFNANMGISAGKYLENLRLQHALSLLQSTNDTLGEIADACGLCDANYLCRLIRKHYNTTPGKIRNTGWLVTPLSEAEHPLHGNR